MNRRIPILFALVALAGCERQPTTAQVSPGVPINDYQDDDISLVLRTLARQGNFEIILASNITGTVTLRVYNKTPREVFDMISATKNLVVNQRDGVLYVSTKSSVPTPSPFPK